MNDERVEGIRDTPYLGVTLNSKLKWDTHISKISSAANRTLGLLWRNLRLCPRNIKEAAYKSYVRPKVEYCSNIWDPYTQNYIKKEEMVQHRGTRFVTNTPHHRHQDHQTSITYTIIDLGWKSLQKRRRNNRIILLYKLANNLVEVPSLYHPELRHPQPRRGNQHQYQRLAAEVQAFENSFLPRSIVDWNNLSASTVAADSLESLKRHLM